MHSLSDRFPIGDVREGLLLGDACHNSCSSSLQHVFCDEYSHTCECQKKYPVRLTPNIGCAKPVRLGEQCFYERTCNFNEPHSTCIQIHHNAICQCKPGYHVVALQKPRERIFYILVIKTDMNTLFGMAAGIAIITGLICFVLKLYSRARYAPPRHYANANLPPPILFASETGIPLAVHRPPSRNSGTRSAPPFSRRPSSSLGLIGCNSSRAGAARAAAILLISCHFAAEASTPSTASFHSSTSSVRSYGVRRLEQENEQRYQRQLARMQASAQAQNNSVPSSSSSVLQGSSSNLQLMHSSSLGSCSGGSLSYGHSCRTPLSTDDLLPSVTELNEPSSQPGSSGSQHKARTTSLQPIIAPSSSSDSSDEASPMHERSRH
ncbi:hypothetical protein B566_EDAN010927 [Ephemera danica]|nr:hypothetical protein B566_EDAN010927 [Ephemera danica]